MPCDKWVVISFIFGVIMLWFRLVDLSVGQISNVGKWTLFKKRLQIKTDIVAKNILYA
jgi:hypothetical protein